MISNKEISVNKKQQGVALIVAMVLLLIMTMVGTSGMNKSLQSMNMSKSFIDYNYSYQFAETGLRLAEDILKSAKNQEDADTLLDAANISREILGDYTDPDSWNNVKLFNSQFPVKIHVEEWNVVSDNLQIGSGSSTVIVYYRITARSFDPMYQTHLESGNGESKQMGHNQTVLQSIYAVRFEN